MGNVNTARRVRLLGTIAVLLIALSGCGWPAARSWPGHMFQFAYLGHYPFWSFTLIVIDILVIYGLAAHGGRVNEYDEA